MFKHAYLNWMSKNTDTQWCNDSAIISEIEAALKSGATGCTSNPPLSYLSLIETPKIFHDEMSKIPQNIKGNDRVVQLIGVVVRHISKMLYEIFEKSGGTCGYIRSQVQPDLSSDAEAMLKMGLIIASWGKNVMVKIPGTAAGMIVLEELAARGIPTTPTVCVTVSQIVAAAEAYKRGVKRAKSAGIKPAPSTAAFVMGRLQDYLTSLNQERNTGLSKYDLDCAALAAAKRCYKIFMDNAYEQVLMPAAFRAVSQVEQMAGSKVVMTIHPSIQSELIKADEEGKLQRKSQIENHVDPYAILRVKKALPEFELAYEPDALTYNEFDTYGATVMTLNAFDVTGWQKLRTL